MGIEVCSVCGGAGERQSEECWFCEGTGWHPTCVICDAPVEPGNPWGTNELCRFHAAEVGSEIQELV